MSNGPLAVPIREAGVPITELDQTRGRLTAAGLKGLLAAVRDFAPAILQGHMYHSNILSRLVGVFRRKVLVVNTLHSGWEPIHRRAFYAITGFLVDGSIAYGFPAAPETRKREGAGSSLRRVPYGIPSRDGDFPDRSAARDRLGLPGDRPVWLAVGRLSSEKGHADLIMALSEIDLSGASPVVVIVGEGGCESQLRGLIAHRNLQERVILAGYQADLRDYMTAADYFVLPSRWEAGPLVVLEAMSFGLPVVATDVGQVRSMIIDGETGIIVPPSEPGELARAMKRLMDSGDGARELGLRGRDRTGEHCDFSVTCREMERYYLELLGGVHGKGGGFWN